MERTIETVMRIRSGSREGKVRVEEMLFITYANWVNFGSFNLG